jgi:hypothetical protein
MAEPGVDLQVEPEDVDPALPVEAEKPPVGVLGD